MMTRGRGGVKIPLKSDDVIYEQPFIHESFTVSAPQTLGVSSLMGKGTIPGTKNDGHLDPAFNPQNSVASP